MPTSPFELADAQLSAVLAVMTAQAVRVIRSSTVMSDAWLATPGTFRQEVGVESEISIVGDRTDWIGDPTDWVYDGAPTHPTRGDLIEWTRTRYTHVYEVIPADGEDVWSPSGSFGNRIRVHTKLIELRPLS